MKALLPTPTQTACRRWILTATWVLLASLALPAWAAAPFTVNGNGTVSDATTGLLWDQCVYGKSGSDCATVTTPALGSWTAPTGTWSAALTAAVEANAASYKGFSDWRVPNKNELESINKLDTYTAGQAAIDATAFPNTPISGDSWGLGFTWTSTTYAPDTSSAWIVGFNRGDTWAFRKSDTNYVRLVRSGQSLAPFDALGGPTGLLNDTGQTQCNNGSAMVACDATTTGDASARPRQDGRFGRDPASTVSGTLTKVGGGAAGFDFTKVCMDGTLNCAAAADTSASPARPAAWACTKDNVTNLIWSLYSGQGEWTTYARTTLPNAENAQGRCGFNTGWRLPTRRELLSIVHYDGQSPSIDSNYFPATQPYFHSTNDPYHPDPAKALVVDFSYGSSVADDTRFTNYVRLVRSGQ